MHSAIGAADCAFNCKTGCKRLIYLICVVETCVLSVLNQDAFIGICVHACIK